MPEKLTSKKEAPVTQSKAPTTTNTVSTPAPVLKRRTDRKRASALSLKSIHHKPEELVKTDETEIDRNTLPKDSFTKNEFLDAWKSFAEKTHKKGDKSLASILLASKPEIKNSEIHFTLPNSLMKDQMQRARPQLMKHVRETLNNFSLDLHIRVEETEVKNFIYTPQEKYGRLKEISPEIEYLKSKFKLDL